MSELVDFVNRMLDEDEATARAAMTQRWDVDTDRAIRAARGEVTFVNVVDHRWGGWVARTDAVGDSAHIARHDPARVLAEVNAKRAILALHRPSTDHGERYEPYCVGCWEAGGEDGAPSYPCPTVRLLASVWVDAPGFREEWRP